MSEKTDGTEQVVHTDGRIRAVDGFEPRKFITRVGAADYLEVKWRLLWLRTYDPDADIQTELISHENSTSIFKCKITLSEKVGGGSATGWGSESYDDFRDYLEKSETKAVGRALAALGFGTQFTPDFDFGSDAGRVVDTPVRLARQHGNLPDQGQQRQQNTQGDGQQQRQPGQGITERQISFIRQIARDKNINDQQLHNRVSKLFGKTSLNQLERYEASSLIERLKSYQPAIASTTPENYEPVINQETGEIVENEDIPF